MVIMVPDPRQDKSYCDVADQVLASARFHTRAKTKTMRLQGNVILKRKILDLFALILS